MFASRTAPAPRARALAVLLASASLLLGAAPAFAQALDLSGWQALLDRYVIRLGDGRKEPADTRFDYEQLYVDEGIWTKKRSDRLEAVHAQLFAVQPSLLDAKTRLAWALNAYNFLVVERATLLLLVPRRQFQRYSNVDQMTSPDGAFFDALVAEIEGRKYSIAAFERRFVYGDTTPMIEPRTAPADPRLMFALCRGSVGGPALAPRAFRPESLEAQLDQASRNALAMPHMLKWDAAAKQLVASGYLGLRLRDFGGSGEGIVRFAVEHGPPALRSILKREKPANVTRFLPPDPTLNQFLRPKPAPPAPDKPES